MSNETIHFVHISDTHIGPTPEFALHGRVTAPLAHRMVATINGLPYQPDFVVHTGDIVASPDPDSFVQAARIFARLNAPIYYVTGNHDTSAGIHMHLRMGKKSDLVNDRGVLSYLFERRGYRFLVLDGRGSDEIDPHGVLSKEQLELLGMELRRDDTPLVIFIHFPALPLDSIWYDRDMLLLNGEEFHRLLVPARERIKGVFFGHVHRGMHILKDGILYSGVASTSLQFKAWPGDRSAYFDEDHPPAFNFVTLTGGQTIIKEHIVIPGRD